LERVPGCVRVQLGGADIVRHPLVQRIVDAYDG
jgi:phosphate starvation-inducible protein PhoH